MLEDVVFPDSLEIIGNDVFTRTKIKNLTIPRSVINLDSGNSFDLIETLEYAQVAPENPKFISIDGILYTRDMKTLYIFPKNKNITYFSVPYGVETITVAAFSGTRYVSTLVISETVRTIGAYFCRYSAVQAVIIKQRKGKIRISENDLFKGTIYNVTIEYLNRHPESCACNIYNQILISFTLLSVIILI
ncbi:cell surface protein, putative [Trichomonas vaginalis G3]|uniref:Cell surface protein, putative n=1 Tax=Trichomonas vaginalis (strain ATCC PRA-98 / G3) TaxID=412133 RepID=A2FV66_TRIV3|nr:ribonuclease inhibitor domain-containing protein [Trichomonas vaginalis G3]EAX91202.1 cell surface protein, putative [Trichomonas vaginalis G3]KAI5517082.1 ribonuclease inhibitor domain-containing protein [Trichomonas vaginalis G3]|eukprot:XP_001304132.1 cell surface protein [Trichomonas vaginalis G3]